MSQIRSNCVIASDITSEECGDIPDSNIPEDCILWKNENDSNLKIQDCAIALSSGNGKDVDVCTQEYYCFYLQLLALLETCAWLQAKQQLSWDEFMAADRPAGYQHTPQLL